jgi:hypothetical protein
MSDKYHGGVPTDHMPPAPRGRTGPEYRDWRYNLALAVYVLMERLRPKRAFTVWALDHARQSMARRLQGREDERGPVYDAAMVATVAAQKAPYLATRAVKIGSARALWRVFAVTAGVMGLAGLSTLSMTQRAGALAVIGSESSGGGTISPLPQQFYISTGSNASDSNNGSIATPFATIAHAQSVAGTGAALFVLSGGVFSYSATDANGNAITLLRNQAMVGYNKGSGESDTEGTTIIDLKTAAFTYGIEAADKFVKVADLTVRLVSGTCTYACGTSCAPGAGAAAGLFSNVAVVDLAGVGVTGAYAYGPDHSGSSTMDLGQGVFFNCSAEGTSNVSGAGFIFGNGTTGNIVQPECYGCWTSDFTNGVLFRGGCGVKWFGGSLDACTGADISLTGPRGLDPIIFTGVRGDTGNTVLDTSGASGNGPFGGISLIQYEAYNYTPNLGHGNNIIEYTLSGKLELLGGVYTTAAANTTFFAHGGAAATPCTFIAIGVFCDNLTCWPAQNSKCQRIFIGNIHPSSGTYIPNPNAYFIIDNITTSGALSTVSVVSGTARQVSTVAAVDLYVETGTAGSVAVALSPDNVTTTTIYTRTVAATDVCYVHVPAGWFVTMTASGGTTLGTATYTLSP